MNICRYWNCNTRIRYGHFLCYEHHADWEEYLINKCPGCGRYKDVEYDLCLDCYNKRKIVDRNRFGRSEPINKSYRLEHSKAWEKKDKEAERFFVYILKDEKGKFYVGQTRDLRARMSEHRDGKTRSIAGRGMKLQYFEECKNRPEVELREVELKKLIDHDERQVRKMIIEFQDRIREVKFE